MGLPAACCGQSDGASGAGHRNILKMQMERCFLEEIPQLLWEASARLLLS